jgi:hypothetical protein
MVSPSARPEIRFIPLSSNEGKIRSLFVDQAA